MKKNLMQIYSNSPCIYTRPRYLFYCNCDR